MASDCELCKWMEANPGGTPPDWLKSMEEDGLGAEKNTGKQQRTEYILKGFSCHSAEKSIAIEGLEKYSSVTQVCCRWP